MNLDLNNSRHADVSIPMVSIGMPVYNGEKFIRHAIDSLLVQTFTDFELIISDNSSTDNTEAICLEYMAHDSRIRYFRQNENHGSLFNFKFVLDESDGKYFKWMAVDDLLGTPETLANLVKGLNKGFELAIPDIDILDEKTKITKHGVLSSVFRKGKPHNFTMLALQFPSFQIYGLFQIGPLRNFFPFIRKNIDLSCFSEGIFVHAISHKFRCIFVDDGLLIYRRHYGNISSNVIPPALLKNFLIYTYRVFGFYLSSSFAISDKIYYLSILLYKHIKYLICLLAATGKYYCLRIKKKFRLYS
ncbi:glycosyltransferase family 2 protein [Desulfobacula sp.]|uniref:glycosyltransferase family 2 protein n=1 Tax=Desulfobacula sp. TaxID=2593537 RepID=UPI002639FA74|nr:glycosyltransferase family 2 protein [Desulfobacula sp.]